MNIKELAAKISGGSKTTGSPKKILARNAKERSPNTSRNSTNSHIPPKERAHLAKAGWAFSGGIEIHPIKEAI